MSLSKVRKLKRHVEHEERLEEFKLTQAFFNALENHQEINADIVVREAAKLRCSPEFTVHLLANLFRRFANKKAGLMDKVKNKFVLSERNSGPIQVYKSRIYKGVK